MRDGEQLFSDIPSLICLPLSTKLGFSRIRRAIERGYFCVARLMWADSRRWALLRSIQTTRDVALIILYGQQGVKSFTGTVGAFINWRYRFETRYLRRIVVDSFIKACFLKRPRFSLLPSLSSSVSHLVTVATRVIFIHTYVASYARRRFFTHVSHLRQVVVSRLLIVIAIARILSPSVSIGCWAWTISRNEVSRVAGARWDLARSG